MHLLLFKREKRMFCPLLDLHYLRATIQYEGWRDMTHEELKALMLIPPYMRIYTAMTK